MAKWLSGGRRTLSAVQSYIASSEEHWRRANVAIPLAPGQVNISFGVVPDWRGKGIAQRALDLMSSYLKSTMGVRQRAIRISVENLASLRAIKKAGFQLIGIFDELEGVLAGYLCV